MKDTNRELFAITLMSVTALALAGCWTPPTANVQPKGQAGLIQSGIMVESVKTNMTVVGIDDDSTITLQPAYGAPVKYPLAPKVKHLRKVQVGDMVEPTMKESLDVYCLVNGRLPAPDGGTGGEVINANAKVLLVDPSYRLLTLQYPDGSSETFKPGTDAKLLQMAPGDSVVVQPVEVTALSIQNP